MKTAHTDTEVWWLVGPQGSGRTAFAQRMIAAYQARGKVAVLAEDSQEFKAMIRYEDGARQVTRVRLPYQSQKRNVDVLMVQVYDPPQPSDRRYLPSDRVIHFPLTRSSTAPSRWHRVGTWLRNKLWIWLAALALTVVTGYDRVRIDDGAEAIAADVLDAQADARLAANTERWLP